jgi:methionyl-tRNA formyltransferase
MRETPIAESDNAQILHDRLTVLGAELLLETIPAYIGGRITPQPQPDGATYARKIEKSDGLIDWEQPAVEIGRRLRAFTPWPGAFTFLETDGKRRMIKILEVVPGESMGSPGTVLSASREGIVVGTGNGSIRIVSLQPEGRKRMSAQDFLAGHHLRPGQVFTR